MPTARPTDPYPEISWWGWGDPAEVPELPDGVRTLLREALGVTPPGGRPASIAEVTLPPVRLSGAIGAELAAAVGPQNALSDPESRVRHTRGKSTPDLLRIRAREARDAPDLVVLPASHQEALEVLRICSQHRVAVVPFGGGTSVVGGLAPASGDLAGVVALDLRRMKSLRGPQAEELPQGGRSPTIMG